MRVDGVAFEAQRFLPAEIGDGLQHFAFEALHHLHRADGHIVIPGGAPRQSYA